MIQRFRMSGPPHARAALKGRRVLVTGARGFLGSHLMVALAAEGADARPFKGDIVDAGAVNAAVSSVRPELVFHLAAYGTTPVQQEDARIRDVNIGGAERLWDAIDRWPCRVVHTGTCGEYGPAPCPLTEDHPCHPTSVYTQSVHDAVLLSLDRARRGDRERIVLRPCGPFGPGDRPERLVPHVIDGLLSGKRVAVTSGEQRRDYSYVSDHVRAMILAGTTALDERSTVLNIGAGAPIRVRTLVETIAALVDAGALARVGFGDVPLRQTDLSDMFADTRAARRVLGYEPVVSLEEGLARTIAWHRTARSGSVR